MMDFEGKVAVVTDAGSGTVRACAQEFSEKKTAVAVLDRNGRWDSKPPRNFKAYNLIRC
jgi:NAD(P)-dependent dehydrogenase (short-subunit alcohol dehydrogenase family)